MLGERTQCETKKRKKERYGGTLQGKRIGGWVVPAADVQLDKGEVYFSFKYCLVHNAVSFSGTSHSYTLEHLALPSSLCVCGGGGEEGGQRGCLSEIRE